MDGYKKFIAVGCLALLGGYLLPWPSALGQTTTGLALLHLGYDAISGMHQVGQYDYGMVATYSALALPALGAVLSLLYCLLWPARSNGSFGTFLFLLPLFSLVLTYLYLGAIKYDILPGGLLTSQVTDMILDQAMDLSKTAGLWLVHLGVFLMMLGRLGR
ncbi:MAG: hypothetical protein KKB70_00755 [Proteobacteria bacterium]|nr:hypothetical protein [Pseudomonadota bacterium]MBU1611934.1 hypothetical protein [Pseudomonadota bacterium]